MRVEITSIILRPLVNISNTAARPNLIWNSFISLECLYRTRLILKLSPRSSFASPVQVTGNTMHFIQLASLQVQGHFGVLKSLAVLLLQGTLFIDIFVETCSQ